MAENTATDAAGLESSLDLSIVQHNENEDAEGYMRITGSSNDLSLLQNVSTSTTISGGGGGGGSKGRLDTLKENLSKQQERLMELRTRAQHRPSNSESIESLKALEQRLTVLKTRSGGGVAVGDASTPLATPTKDTKDKSLDSSLLHASGSEKLLMLTQRTEQNRALLEQRKRDMAKSLLSIRSSLSQSQSRSHSRATADLGSSMTDLRQAAVAEDNAPVSRHRSALDLQQQQQQLQQADALDETRMKLLKNRMKVNELKQSRQEQEVLELRQELARRASLIEQLELSGAELQRTLTQRDEELERVRADAERADAVPEINSLQEQEHTRLHSEVVAMKERLSELENINDMLETTRCELTDELSTAREQLQQHNSQTESTTTEVQVNEELAKQLSALQAAYDELRREADSPTKLQVNDSNVSECVNQLEATIAAQTTQLEEQKAAMAEQSEELAEKTTELNVLNVNLRLLEEKLAQSSRSKPLFLDDEDHSASEQLRDELQQLKQKLDESNKANIKLKLKCKQVEKQLQKIQSEDSQQKLAALAAQNEELQQRITVLEDEKGQWQLSSMQEEGEGEEQTQHEINPLQREAVRLLEEQKMELQQALEALQQGNESARVESELSEVHMEEHLSQRVHQLEQQAQEQIQQLQTLQAEKDILDKKLSHYVNENMELLDKLEKISASSSAESIEIVERPSQQQLECFAPRRPASEGDAQEQKQQQHQEEQEAAAAPIALLPSVVSELTQTDLTSEASESLNQLREERHELLQRIELFSNERREVLEKMEQLTAENGDFQARLDGQKEQLERLTGDNSRLESRLSEGHQQKEELQREKEQLSLQLSERSNLSQELSSMQRSSEVVAALDAGEGGPALFDKCERSLSKLNSELEAYRKADRQAKINASKKLAKEAKNCHTQLTELLQKVKEASTAVETVTVVETVVAVTAPNGKALAEYEKLTAQNAELKAELSRLRLELEELQDSCEPEAPQLAIAAVDEQRPDFAPELLELQTTLKELRSQESDQRQQIEEQLQTIAELRGGESEHLQTIASQEAKLTQLQQQVEQFHQVLNTKEMGHEKYMEQQTRIRRELEGRAESMEGELSILKALVAEQKQQLIENLSESEHTLNLKILELQSAQAELRELRAKEEDPGHLKESLRVSKSLAAQQVSELATKQETIEALNQQLQELYQSLDQAKQEEQHKHRELREKLKKYALNLKKRSQENADLEQKLKEFTERPQEAPIDQEQVEKLQSQVARLNEELKAKIHVNLESRDAQRQLREQLQEQEHLLQQRDEEQQRLHMELQNTVRANTELRREQAHWEQQQTEQEHNLADLYRQLEQKSTKFDKSKEVIKHRNATIQALQRELQQLRLHAEDKTTAAVAAERAEPREEEALLRAQLQAAEEQHSLLAQQYARDKADFQVTIGRLETIHGGIQAKLQQDATYIESLESQNTELLAKSADLEEQLTSLANQQAAAQDRVNFLEQQLQQNSAQQKEHETQLRERVRELAEREQAHNRQMELIAGESEDSREQLVQLQAEYDALRVKHGQLMAQAQAERETLSSQSEEELADLREQLALRESEMQRQRQVYDAKLAAKATELDENECDLNAHMERSSAENRELTQQLERAHEQIRQRGEDLSRVTEEMQEVERERSNLSREVTLLRLQQDSAEQDVLELQELRMQVIQDKTEMDNLRSQIDSLCANHTQELQLLQQQIAEWDTLGQNQTDDQVYIETENKRLTEQLIELQARLEEQAGQLAAARQRSAEASVNAPAPAASFFFASDTAAAPSPFDEIVQPLRVSSQQLSAAPPQPTLPPPPTIEDLQRNVSDLEKHAQDLETKLLARNQAVADQERRLAELERMLHERDQELAEIRAAEEERERLAALEKLIQPTGAPSLDMFFGVGGAEESVPDAVTRQQLDWGQPQAEPVVEPLITPKKAYICHPQEHEPEHEPLQAAVDWGVDEDPWASAAQDIEIRTQPDGEAMHARIGQLEQQLATAEQQKAELQTKTAKLMKRLKEYKSKAVVTVTASAPDNDLDGAIIEELKHQLQLQEARQAKNEELVQQHSLEREKLSKRIDVLTAGNDRMSELKERQDRDVQMYQARIRELQEKITQMDQWDVPATVAVAAPPLDAAAAPKSSGSDAEALIKIENLQAENADLNAECQELQSQLREERRQAQLAEETAAQAQAQREELRERLQQLEEELDELRANQVEANELHSLRLEVEQLRSRQSELEELRAQKVDVEQRLTQRQAEIEELRRKQQQQQAEIEELRRTQQQPEQSVTTSASASDEQMAQLQEKESEIVHLKQRIEELMREDQTEKLVFEILTKNQELQLLRTQIKQLQEEREESAPPPAVATTESDQELQQLRAQCQQMQLEKSDMEEELRVLNNHVMTSLELEDKMKHTVLQLDTKNIEIAELRKSLEQLQQSQSQSPAQIPDLDSLNQQWEAVVEQKCGEVANIWQDHLSQREAAFKAQLEQIQQQLQQQQQQQQYHTESAVPQAEDSDSLLKMQKALETQEMEIVTLKEQLAIRSAEYARLAAQYDPFRLQHQQAAGGAAGVETQSEYVLKADLDYALMMLHQRDMRVEEMILELGQLLQERDHLQLKLSDTLRQLETERVRASDDPALAASVASSATASSSTASGSTPRKTSNASSTDLAVVTNTRGSDLKQKLAELQTVKHSKDKAIVDEREQRLQQMVQLQRDMAKQGSGSAVVTTVTPLGASTPGSQPPLGVDHSQPTPRSPTMGLMDWILGNKSEDDHSQHATN